MLCFSCFQIKSKISHYNTLYKFGSVFVISDNLREDQTCFSKKEPILGYSTNLTLLLLKFQKLSSIELDKTILS